MENKTLRRTVLQYLLATGTSGTNITSGLSLENVNGDTDTADTEMDTMTYTVDHHSDMFNGKATITNSGSVGYTKKSKYRHPRTPGSEVPG